MKGFYFTTLFFLFIFSVSHSLLGNGETSASGIECIQEKVWTNDPFGPNTPNLQEIQTHGFRLVKSAESETYELQVVDYWRFSGPRSELLKLTNQEARLLVAVNERERSAKPETTVSGLVCSQNGLKILCSNGRGPKARLLFSTFLEVGSSTDRLRFLDAVSGLFRQRIDQRLASLFVEGIDTEYCKMLQTDVIKPD